MREKWARPLSAWCTVRDETKSSWRARQGVLDMGILTLHSDSASHDAGQPHPLHDVRAVYNLVGTACRVACLADGDAEATAVHWPAGVEPAGCFVVLVPHLRSLYLYVDGDHDGWRTVLKACSKVRLPARKAQDKAPADIRKGWSAAVVAGRDVGADVLFKVYVHHVAKSGKYDRITCFVTYEDLVYLHNDLQVNPLDEKHPIELPFLPTGRAFRSKDPGFLEERVELLSFYLDALIGMGPPIVRHLSARKIFHLDPLLEKLGLLSHYAKPVVVSPTKRTISQAALGTKRAATKAGSKFVAVETPSRKSSAASATSTPSRVDSRTKRTSATKKTPTKTPTKSPAAKSPSKSSSKRASVASVASVASGSVSKGRAQKAKLVDEEIQAAEDEVQTEDAAVGTSPIRTTASTAVGDDEVEEEEEEELPPLPKVQSKAAPKPAAKPKAEQAPEVAVDDSALSEQDAELAAMQRQLSAIESLHRHSSQRRRKAKVPDGYVAGWVSYYEGMDDEDGQAAAPPPAVGIGEALVYDDYDENDQVAQADAKLVDTSPSAAKAASPPKSQSKAGSTKSTSPPKTHAKSASSPPKATAAAATTTTTSSSPPKKIFTPTIPNRSAVQTSPATKSGSPTRKAAAEEEEPLPELPTSAKSSPTRVRPDHQQPAEPSGTSGDFQFNFTFGGSELQGQASKQQQQVEAVAEQEQEESGNARAEQTEQAPAEESQEEDEEEVRSIKAQMAANQAKIAASNAEAEQSEPDSQTLPASPGKDVAATAFNPFAPVSAAISASNPFTFEAGASETDEAAVLSPSTEAERRPSTSSVIDLMAVPPTTAEPLLQHIQEEPGKEEPTMLVANDYDKLPPSRAPQAEAAEEPLPSIYAAPSPSRNTRPLPALPPTTAGSELLFNIPLAPTEGQPGEPAAAAATANNPFGGAPAPAANKNRPLPPAPKNPFSDEAEDMYGEVASGAAASKPFPVDLFAPSAVQAAAESTYGVVQQRDGTAAVLLTSGNMYGVVDEAPQSDEVSHYVNADIVRAHRAEKRALNPFTNASDEEGSEAVAFQMLVGDRPVPAVPVEAEAAQQASAPGDAALEKKEEEEGAGSKAADDAGSSSSSEIGEHDESSAAAAGDGAAAAAASTTAATSLSASAATSIIVEDDGFDIPDPPATHDKPKTGRGDDSLSVSSAASTSKKRRSRGLFGGLFGSNRGKRDSKGASPSPARRNNAFLAQAREFEAQVQSEEQQKQSGNVTNITNITNNISLSTSAGDDPMRSMLKMYHKIKHDKKALLTIRQQLSFTLLQTTRTPNMNGSVAFKELTDTRDKRPRHHRHTKRFHAALRGPVLSLFKQESDKVPHIGPLYCPAGSVRAEKRKKGNALRITSLQGTYVLYAKDRGELELWQRQLNAPSILHLDCCHYISTEAKDALEEFVQRTMELTPSPEAVRLPVTMLGMDGAGKTSIIKALTTQGAASMVTQPTEGCRDLEVVWSPRLVFDIRDVSGADPAAWPRYYSPPPYALIYVVDSLDKDRFPTVKAHIGALLGALGMGVVGAVWNFLNPTETPSLRHTMIVVALNKQGYNEKNVTEPEQLCTMLDLDRCPTPITAVVSCNARLGAGVLDIFTFLAGALPWEE